MDVASRSLLAHGDPPVYFTFAGLAAAGVPHATTTRHCPGVTPPSEPAGPFTGAAAAALAPARLALARVAHARQVHGAVVATAPAAGGFVGPADAIVTAAREVPVAVFSADCLAVVLCDPVAVGVVHAGWRGTARGVVSAAVAALVKLGARPERLRAAIAPSIGPCCYEVDGPVAAAFSEAYPDRWRAWFTPRRTGHYMLDLWSANEALLLDAGLPPANVENPRLCTACHPELLFSYRRGHRGRLVTVAALPSPRVAAAGRVT